VKQCPSHCVQNINSKDIKARLKTLKVLEENMKETFQDIGIGNDFLNTKGSN
jgi:hypothetical protein